MRRNYCFTILNILFLTNTFLRLTNFNIKNYRLHNELSKLNLALNDYNIYNVTDIKLYKKWSVSQQLNISQNLAEFLAMNTCTVLIASSLIRYYKNYGPINWSCKFLPTLFNCIISALVTYLYFKTTPNERFLEGYVVNINGNVLLDSNIATKKQFYWNIKHDYIVAIVPNDNKHSLYYDSNLRQVQHHTPVSLKEAEHIAGIELKSIEFIQNNSGSILRCNVSDKRGVLLIRDYDAKMNAFER